MKQNHTHKYQKGSLGRNKWPIHRCMIPNCSHYISTELVEGKSTICWRCGENLIMGKAQMRMVKPHCSSCVERKVTSATKETVESILRDLDLFGDSGSISEPIGEMLDLDDNGET